MDPGPIALKIRLPPRTQDSTDHSLPSWLSWKTIFLTDNKPDVYRSVRTVAKRKLDSMSEAWTTEHQMSVLWWYDKIRLNNAQQCIMITMSAPALGWGQQASIYSSGARHNYQQSHAAIKTQTQHVTVTCNKCDITPTLWVWAQNWSNGGNGESEVFWEDWNPLLRITYSAIPGFYSNIENNPWDVFVEKFIL